VSPPVVTTEADRLAEIGTGMDESMSEILVTTMHEMN
jgi:hypothetical protein